METAGNHLRERDKIKMSKKLLIRKILTAILLLFVTISIAYLPYKYFVESKSNPQALNLFQSSDSIIVSYMHSTFRCSSCNSIEEMTFNLLQDQYSAYLNDGSIIWQSIDFQQEVELAGEFEIVASCVVISKMNEKKILEFRRLDEVWTKLGNPVEFNRYLCENIDYFIQSQENIK